MGMLRLRKVDEDADFIYISDEIKLVGDTSALKLLNRQGFKLLETDKNGNLTIKGRLTKK